MRMTPDTIEGKIAYYNYLSRPGLRSTIDMLQEARKQGLLLSGSETNFSIATLRQHFGNTAETIAHLVSRRSERILTLQ